MVGISALGDWNSLAVPALPSSGLVSAHQHDRAAVWIKGEQDSDAPGHPQLLEVMDPGGLDRVDTWPPEDRTNPGDAPKRGGDLRRALGVEVSKPPLEVMRSHHTPSGPVTRPALSHAHA